jgi:hypothetical protein
LSLVPADLVGAGEPAKISRLVGVLGNEEALSSVACHLQ